MKSIVAISVALLSSVVSAQFQVDTVGNLTHFRNGKPSSHPIIDSKVFNLFDIERAAILSRTTVLSNSELMARGLAPQAPTNYNKKRHVPSKLKARGNKAPTPSSTPGCPCKGNIVVVTDSGVLGYVSEDTSIYGTYTITQKTSAAATFSRPRSSKSNFNLEVSGAEEPFFGGAIGFSGSNWGKGSSGYGFIVPTANAPAPATVAENPTGQVGISNLWSIDCSTGELTATWTNDDGTKVPTTLFYDVTFGDLDLTGDLALFTETFGDVTEAISFFLVE